MHSVALITLALCLSSASARFSRVSRQVDAKANGALAIAENEKFKGLTPDSACKDGENACVNAGFAQCVGGKFIVQPCAGGTICASLPLVNAAGTSITCTTQADLDARIAATGATAAAPPAQAPTDNNNQGNNNGGNNNNNGGNNGGNNQAPPAAPPAGNNAGGGNAAGGDLQTSLTLDNSVISKNFADDGQNPPVTGQTASSTSTNNYINFCALTLPQIQLTDGQQVLEGSCNTAPIGLIPSVDKMPSAKFSFPKNFGTVPVGQDFTVTLNVKNFQTGTFTNALKTYFAAPQTLNGQGEIIGHSHITVEKLVAIDSTDPLDPKKPFFFKGINTAAVNGVLSVVVTGGVQAGPHRVCTINSSANHQPVIVPIAQHGSLDDCVYFTGV